MLYYNLTKTAQIARKKLLVCVCVGESIQFEQLDTDGLPLAHTSLQLKCFSTRTPSHSIRNTHLRALSGASVHRLIVTHHLAAKLCATRYVCT